MIARPPRVGRIAFVNCFPLYLHFEEELAARGYTAEVVAGSPAELNRWLVEGRIDFALPSSIEFARHAQQLVLLEGLAIGSTGAVDSVQLFSSVPVQQSREVALTEKSATSVVLLKVLFEAWGLHPHLAPRLQPLSETLRRFDGLLLIGDEALQTLRAGVYPFHVDLGEAWHELTGLPMVFAVCVARREFCAAQPDAAAAVLAALAASRDRCAAHPHETAAAAALAYDFSQSYLLDYFDRLRYGFGPEHRRGLLEFYRRAVAVGELARVPDVPEVATDASALSQPDGGAADAREAH